MKIGILTYHFVSNFGANLQTISTYYHIESTGNVPFIIDWRPEGLESYYNTVVSREQNEAFFSFARKHYKNITSVCRSSEDIAEAIDKEELDLVIIGSDAVLTYLPILCRYRITRKGPKYIKPNADYNFPNAFWGDFFPLVKRPIKMAIMSGSAQNTDFSKIFFKKSKFANALMNFSYVSVRDIWTKKMLSFLTKQCIDAKITPDPVFAFNFNVKASISKEEILSRFNLSPDYVLLTIDNGRFSREWKRELEEEFVKNDIVLYELGQANKTPSCVLKNRIEFPIDPLEWYFLIKYAKGYVGELMHPVLVSLHNSTPVYVVDTYGFKDRKNEYGINTESSKTFQIINRFGLLDNYYNVNSSSAIEKPCMVVSKIMSFDKMKCQKNAAIMYDEYKRMMIDILNLIK